MGYLSLKKTMRYLKSGGRLLAFYPAMPRYIEGVPEVFVYFGSCCVGKLRPRHYTKLLYSGTVIPIEHGFERKYGQWIVDILKG